MRILSTKYAWLVAIAVVACINPMNIYASADDQQLRESITSTPAPPGAGVGAGPEQWLSPAERATLLSSALALAGLLLLLCLLNACAASPACCPYAPGALVDSDYSSESLAYLRWTHAPHTRAQRLARTLTHALLPLRTHAFYRPSRDDGAAVSDAQPSSAETLCRRRWPAAVRAALFGAACGLSCRGHCLSCEAEQAEEAWETVSAAAEDARAAVPALARRCSLTSCACRQRHQPPPPPPPHDRPSRCRVSLDALRRRLGYLGLPRTLLAGPPDVSEKWLVRRLQQLDRRRRRAERRAARMEARERGHITRDRERRVRRRDKEMRKRERKLDAQRRRDRKALERSAAHAAHAAQAPDAAAAAGWPVPGTSTAADAPETWRATWNALEPATNSEASAAVLHTPRSHLVTQLLMPPSTPPVSPSSEEDFFRRKMLP